MQSNLNAYFKDKVNESINTLSSQIFPQVAKIILEHQCNELFELRGQTTTGEPVGYTVDANSKKFDKVFEFGKEAGYFKDKKNLKLKKDLKHCLTVAPQCSSIYLVSNRNCGPLKYASLNKFTYWGGKRLGKQISIYDGRYISDYIVDEFLEKQDMFNIDKLVPLIPALHQLKNEFIFSNDLPQSPKNNLIRSKDATGISKKLQGSKYIILHGISGIGKTYLALQTAQYLNITHKDWTPIWIQGSTIKAETDLKSLLIDRLGVPVNLIGLMARFKYIVIIDGLEKNISQTIERFENEVSNDFKLIITSQTGPVNLVKHRVKGLDQDLSKEILNLDLKEKCPDEVFTNIYDSIGGHPFLLNQINTSIKNKEADWRKISELLEHVTRFETDNNQAFYDSLFANHLQAAENELGVLKWLNTHEIEFALLDTMVGAPGIRKLIDRDFFNIHNNHGFILHDIVLKSLNNASIRFDRGLLEEKLRKSLEKQFVDFDPRFYRIIHMHSDFIKQIMQREKAHGFFTYCYLLTTTLDDFDERDIPEFKFTDIEKAFKSYRESDYFFIMSWMEFIELISRQLKRAKKFDKLNDFLKERIDEIRSLLAKTNRLKENIKLDINNHLGKFVRNIGDVEGATQIFNAILAVSPNFWAAKFHLSKLYRKTQPQIAQQYLTDILNAYGSAVDVSPTIVLASFKELKMHPGYDQLIVDKFIDSFDDLLKDTMVSKFDLPYEVLGALSSKIHFQEPQKMIDLTQGLPIPSENAIENQTLFDVGLIYFNTAKAYSYVGDSTRLIEYAQQSLAYYGKLKRPNSFQKRFIAESYILLKDVGMAFKMLNEVTEEDREIWWNYTYTKALVTDGKYEDALQKINFCIGLDKDKKNISVLYRERAIIKNFLTDKTCLADYEEAVISCESKKFKNMIVEELELAKIQY